MTTTLISKNPWLTFLALCFGFFLIILDTTIVNIAIPSIMSELHTRIDAILWVLSAYTLAYTTLLVTSGRLGEVLGQRRLFIIGLIVYTLAVMSCGFSSSATQLIVARVFQGIGAALLSPQALAILTTIFPRERRGIVFGAWSAVAGVAAITGPLVGGFIVTYASWRWIFFMDVPIGTTALVLTLLFVPDLRTERRHQLDLTGVALATVGLLAVVFCLIEGQRYDWGEVWQGVSIPGLMIAGMLTLLFFVFWERTRSEPLVPLSIFANRNFSIANGVVAAISFAMIGLLLIVTIYLQLVLGMSALETGQIIAPLSIISMIIAPFAGRWTDKTGGKHFLVAGLALFAAGIGLIAWLAASGLVYGVAEAPSSSDLKKSELLLLVPTILGGAGIGCVISPSTTVAMRDINVQMAGVASGLLSSTRQLGYLLGSALPGTVLQSQFISALHQQTNIYSNQIPSEFRQKFIDIVNDARENGLYMVESSQIVSLNLPQEVENQFQIALHQVFSHSFITAMQPALTMLIVILLMSAFSCFAIKYDQKAHN